MKKPPNKKTLRPKEDDRSFSWRESSLTQESPSVSVQFDLTFQIVGLRSNAQAWLFMYRNIFLSRLKRKIKWKVSIGHIRFFLRRFFFHASNLRFRHFSTNCAGFRGTWVTQPECYWILMGGTGFFFVCGRSDRVRFRNAADTILKQKKKKKKINKARKDWPLKREKLPKSRDWRGRPCRSRRKRRFVSATAVFYVPFFTFVSLGGWLWLLAVDRWRFRCRWVWKWLVWVEKEKEEEADARLRKMKFDEEARSSSVPLSAASDWLIPLRPIGSKPIQHVGRQGGTKRIRLNWIKVKLSPVDRRPNSVRASFFSRSSSFLGRNTMKVGHSGATQLKMGKKRKRRRRRSETR